MTEQQQRDARERLEGRAVRRGKTAPSFADHDLRLALDALDRVRAEIAEWASLPGGAALADLVTDAIDGPDA